MTKNSNNKSPNSQATVKRTRITFDPQAERIKTATNFIERNEYLESEYPYCQLPEHFFDRALLVKRATASDSNSMRTAVLTIDTWDGRPVVQFYRT